MRRVLVTGARGLVGRQVLPRLRSQGHEVHAVSRQAVSDADDVVWHRVDLLDAEAMKQLMASVRPEQLIHLAWYTDPPEYWTSAMNLDWLGASLILLRSFAELGGRRVALAGTCAEYDLRFGFCSEDVTPLAPNTPYGASKLALETVACTMAAQLGISVVVGRVFNAYGPGEHPSRLIPSVARGLLRGEPVDCSHGAQIRDFVHSTDVAGAFAHLLGCDIEGPVNIGSGKPVPVRSVVDRIGTILDRAHLLRIGARPTPPSEPLVLVADTRRITATGWEPTVSLDSGLEATVAWWRDREADRASR